MPPETLVPKETGVLVVGAGPAGAVLAHELSTRGIDVVVLESGPRYTEGEKASFREKKLAAGSPPGMTLYPLPEPAIDRFHNVGSVHLPLHYERNRAVGGTSLTWLGNSPRMPPQDFRMRSLFGVADDWPITYEELEPYYCKAEWSLGIAGIEDNELSGPRSRPYPMPAIPYSYSDTVLKRATEKLGIEIHHTPQARNSVEWGGRPACQSCATCDICPIDAKLTFDVAHIRAAEATGHCVVVPNTTVLRIEVNPLGMADGAVYAGLDKVERKVGARIVVLAAGGIETPRLLLLSRSARFPDGLANSSGLVGRYLVNHPIVNALGRLREPLYPYRVDFESAESFHYYVTDRRDKVGAFLFNFNNSSGMGPRPHEIAAESESWGDTLAGEVRATFGTYASLTAGFEQLPSGDSFLSLDPELTDYFGLAVPRINYNLGPYEERTIREAHAALSKILEAAGARDIYQNPHLWWAGHHMGTTRMGTDPSKSVVDPELRCHDVPNLYLASSSVYVTGGAANPTLTIVALAIRAAERIASS